jgi:hypothetical protein
VSVSSAEALRCSAWARQEGLDPVGSAGSYDGYLLVEVPLPWPRDVGEIPAISAISDLVSRSRVRVQALVPKDNASGDRRVIAYTSRRRAAGHRGFSRTEVSIAKDDDLRDAVSDLLAARAADDDDRRDLLVCTHGRRDACCGSLGIDLVASLTDPLPSDVSVWRTSHTGGHRFAPTFIVLPEATLWAYADTDLVDSVLSRSGDVASVVGRYRGCSGLGSARVQALEREVLRVCGWGLLDLHRSGLELDDGVTVQLDVVGDDGVRDRWQAAVTPGRLMPVPACMRPIDAARKAEHEWTVRDLRQVESEPGDQPANAEGMQG